MLDFRRPGEEGGQTAHFQRLGNNALSNQLRAEPFNGFGEWLPRGAPLHELKIEFCNEAYADTI